MIFPRDRLSRRTERQHDVLQPAAEFHLGRSSADVGDRVPEYRRREARIVEIQRDERRKRFEFHRERDGGVAVADGGERIRTMEADLGPAAIPVQGTFAAGRPGFVPDGKTLREWRGGHHRLDVSGAIGIAKRPARVGHFFLDRTAVEDVPQPTACHRRPGKRDRRTSLPPGIPMCRNSSPLYTSGLPRSVSASHQAPENPLSAGTTACGGPSSAGRQRSGRRDASETPLASLMKVRLCIWEIFVWEELALKVLRSETPPGRDPICVI